MKKEIQRITEDLLICLVLVVVIIVLVLLTGCCSAKVASNTERDSVVISTVYRTEIVKDTVPYYLPIETEKITTKDTISYIENNVAYSEAIISDGYLTHSLGTKDVPHDIVVEKVVEYRDTIVYKEVVKDAETIVEVEKPLTWWQNTQIIVGRVMIIALIILFLWRLIKCRISLLK